MSNQRFSFNGVRTLREQFSDRDLAIIGQVSELRLMTARQIEALYFPAEDHASALSASRSCRRVLAGLSKDKLLIRLNRQVGGVRAGSGSYIYAIGPVGHRILKAQQSRPRFKEPSSAFVDHTLAVTKLVVDLTLASRQGAFEILKVQSEPKCWREFSGMSGLVLLRPDLYLSLGVGDYEQHWFIEIDRGSEHIPALLRKCRVFESYYQSGKEQTLNKIFPKVCFIMPTEKRAEQLKGAIAKDSKLTAQLFVTTTYDLGLEVLTGAIS